MNHKGHWLFGAFLSLAFIGLTDLMNLGFFSYDIGSIAVIVCVVVFYSILPDMDHKSSTITWWFFGVGIFGLVIGILHLIFNLSYVNPISLLIASTLFVVITFLSARWAPHRGFIHTVQAGVLSVVPLWFVFHSFAYCLLGYIAWHSHLIGDGYIFKLH